MKALLIAGVGVFLLLFVVTTLPHSPEAQQAALDKHFTLEQIAQGQELSFQRRLILWASTFITLGFFTFLVFSGCARRLTDRFDRWTGGRWVLTLLLIAGFCFLGERLLRFPLSIISLENWRAWGMSHQSLHEWLEDYGKAVALSAGIGVVMLIGLYALMRWFPRSWWTLAAGLGGLVGVGFALVLPVWIDPLFNNFHPLEDPQDYRPMSATMVGLLGSPLGDGPLLAAAAAFPGSTDTRLTAKIQDMAARAGVPVQEVLVMDASRRGSHTNAYFTGFGATQRIILYDTLLASHPPEEIESILGHEIGHWQHHHIIIGLALAILAGFLGFFLLSRILRWAVNRPPFYLKSPADPAGWPLIVLLSILASWVALPVENAISRHFERQADQAALELAGRPQVFIRAERRLALDNKANLAPTPWNVWLFATHPPAVERMEMARRWEQEQGEDR
jgi:STE24 endopeptidase